MLDKECVHENESFGKISRDIRRGSRNSVLKVESSKMSDTVEKKPAKSDEDKLFRCNQCRKVCKGKIRFALHKKEFHPELLQNVQRNSTDPALKNESTTHRQKLGHAETLPRVPIPKVQDSDAEKGEEKTAEKSAVTHIRKDNNAQNECVPPELLPSKSDLPEVIDSVTSGSDNSSRKSSPKLESSIPALNSRSEEFYAPTENAVPRVQHNKLKIYVGVSIGSYRESLEIAPSKNNKPSRTIELGTSSDSCSLKSSHVSTPLSWSTRCEALVETHTSHESKESLKILQSTLPEENVVLDSNVTVASTDMDIGLMNPKTPAIVNEPVVYPPSPDVAITKRFRCSVCTKFFPTAGALRMHAARHANLTKKRNALRLKCRYCSEVFSSASHRDSHQFHEHPDVLTILPKRPRGRPKKTATKMNSIEDMVNSSHQYDEHPNVANMLSKRRRGRPKKTTISQNSIEDIVDPSRMYRERSNAVRMFPKLRRGRIKKAIIRRNSVEDIVDLTERENFLPFKCSECKESFAKDRLLKQHMRLHSMFECAICKDTFERKCDFHKHLNKHLPKRHKRPVFNRTNLLSSYHPKDSYEAGVRDPEAEPADIKLKLFKVPAFFTPSGFEASAAYWSTAKTETQDLGAEKESFDIEVKSRQTESTSSGTSPQNHKMQMNPQDEMYSSMPVLFPEVLSELKPSSTAADTKPVPPPTKKQVSKRHTCKLCGKSFNSRSNLERHETIHDRSFPCEQCPKSFITELKLETHILRKHTTGDNTTNDYQNYKPFEHADQLRSHSKRNSCFVCSVCGKSFSTRRFLMHHEKMHDRPFPCSLCFKSFLREEKLDMHIRVQHTNEKYQCSFCDKSFTYPSQLGIHLKSHTKTKPFTCNLCGIDFARKDKLDRHVQVVHRNDAETVCSSPVTTMEIDPLPEAELREDEIPDTKPAELSNQLTCPTCSQDFATEDQLNNHILQHLTNPYNIPLQFV